MSRSLNLLFAVLLSAVLLSAGWLGAQTTSTPQDFTYQISAAPGWTDTGLDLQSGDVVEISSSAVSSSVPDRHAVPGAAACDPKGVTGNIATTADLPLPTAAAGVLIARLHAHGAAPVLVGASRELHIAEPSHLFLGMNLTGTPPCEGSLAVKVRKTSAGSAATGAQSASSSPSSSTSSSTAGTKTRGEQLKSQLSSAAQIFMSGQFGTGKPESNTSAAATSEAASSTDSAAAATPLKVADTELDSDLRKQIDTLPRRVNDQLENLGDMVNFVIVGSQKDVQAALDAANWHVADTDDKKAVLSAIMETYEKKDYLQMPMSTLYLFGRRQDFGYEQAEPIAMVASRHHFRIWKAPFTWQGHEVWVGAGTHDIGFAKDQRNGSVTHKIDPAVDGERDNIGSSLQKTDKTKTMSYYLPPESVQEAKNATGDGYHSDGRLLVILLQ